MNPHSTVALYLRGLNLLRARKGAEAAQQFQSLVDHRGANWSPYYPVALVRLARSAQLAGDSSRAKRDYQDFFALWKDADADGPLMREARKEYAALQ